MRALLANTAIPLSTDVPRDCNPAAVYVSRLAPGSRRTMREALEAIAALLTRGRGEAETFAWHTLQYQHTQAVRSVLMARYAPATVNKMLAALRGVLQEAWRLGLMTAENYHRARDLPSVRSHPMPRGRALSRDELQKLFEVCAQDTTPAGSRDAALFALLYGAGLRRSEATTLSISDYHRETGTLIIRGAKGRKDRTSCISSAARDLLLRWLQVRGLDPGPIFCPVRKSGALRLHAMTDQSILYILQKRANEAAIPTLTPHDLRRTYITDLFDTGADIATIRHLAGHTNVQTTVRYDRRGEDAQRRAVELLHVPAFFLGVYQD